MGLLHFGRTLGVEEVAGGVREHLAAVSAAVGDALAGAEQALGQDDVLEVLERLKADLRDRLHVSERGVPGAAGGE